MLGIARAVSRPAWSVAAVDQQPNGQRRSFAIERKVTTEQIAEAEGLALHAAAFNGMPDPVFHLAVRAMGAVLDAALAAATGLQQLLAFRRDVPPPPPSSNRPRQPPG